MSEAFLKVVNMSISAGWLVLAVLALRLILKKAPKWVNVLLWGIVAIRLICPFSIESALSLIPSKETISPEIMMDWTPEISTGIEPLDRVVNPVISTSFAPQGMASANPLQILIPVAANLWLLGVLILLAYTAISYLTLRHKLRTAVILRDNIFQCETVSSPFVLGILKPRIYLPYAMDGKNLAHVIAHEQAHIRRKDHWWKPLGFLLLTVYWFNPLMWVAYILLCRDIELACDEKVIAELGNDQRADYTQALVACAVNRRMIAACPLAFGEVGVKDRIKSIMNYRKPTFWIIVTALVVCLVIAVCFLTDPIENDNADKNPDYFITSYLSNSQQTEIQKAYNRDKRAISVSVQFETTEGPTEINLIYSYKKNGVGNDWTYSDPVSLLLGESAMFTVPADHHFSFSATPLDGPNGNVQLVFTENKSLGNHTNQDEATPEKITFEAEVLEIHDGYFLVKPEPSWAINSADQIEVPTKNMDPALEPQVGDTIEIVCSGEILETYPARLSKVYGINVAKETSRLSLNDVIILSQYGYGLSWTDFDDFDYIETGSGLYIRVYEINDLFQLMIGGGSPDSDPMYIYLKSNDGSDDRIDIRDGGVTEFISEHNTVNINFTGNRNLGLNAEIIEVDSANHILYVKDIDKQDKVFGDRCAINCSYAISQDNLIYVNYDDPNDVRTIEFDDFEVGDSIIIGMYDSEKEKAFNGGAVAEQIQLSTQRVISDLAFEFIFAGNTSGGQKMELTEDKTYWCITVVNEGTCGINIDILGTIYIVDAGTTGHIYPDKAWDPGTYSIDFGTAGGFGMEGYAVCSISSAPFQTKEPFAIKISSAERRYDHPLVVYISSEWAVDNNTEKNELPFNHLVIKEDGSGVIDDVEITWEICEKYTSKQGLHIELWDENEYVVSVVYWRDSQLLQIVDQNDNLLECYYHRIAYATG